jgi:hypothetical protein
MSEFGSAGNKLVERFSEGKDLLPLSFQSDAFELSDAVTSNEGFEFDVASLLHKGYTRDDIKDLVGQLDGETYAFYSQGEKLFESPVTAKVGSMGYDVDIIVEKVKGVDYAEEFHKKTGLPIPSQIGKDGLPALRRRFEDGEKLNADLDDVTTVSDLFRAYGITEITMKEPSNNSDKKEKVKKTVKKTSETLEKSQKYFIAGSFGLTVLGIGYAIIKGEY